MAASAALAHGQAVFEVEPNNNKAQATLAVVEHGTTIHGTTTGASTTTPGIASADYFLVRTAPAPPAIYRYELALTSDPPLHTVTIRGRNQVGGVIGTMDVALQTASALTVPPHIVSWDGFGREEQIYIRVTGSGATPTPYQLTLTRTTISPMPITDPLLAGTVEIALLSDDNTEFVVYNSNFDQVGGNDDDFSIATASSSEDDYGEGVYYVKAGKGNMATDRPAGMGEANLNGNVTDFSNALVGIVDIGGSPGIKLRIDDGINAPSSCVFVLPPNKTNDGKWVCIPLPPKGSCCLSFGGCLLTSEPQCGLQGGLWTPEGACVPNPCIMPGSGACCEGSACIVVPPMACIGPNTQYIGDGVPCNAPGNDGSPCCRADFNQTGMITVQDIFDFLDAFFDGDNSANYNGGPLSVQDLFDFLAGYFDGGCV